MNLCIRDEVTPQPTSHVHLNCLITPLCIQLFFVVNCSRISRAIVVNLDCVRAKRKVCLVRRQFISKLLPGLESTGTTAADRLRMFFLFIVDDSTVQCGHPPS